MSVKSDQYSKVAMGFHWLIALMIIGLIVFGILMTNPETPNRFELYQLHKSFGICVLILSVLRLLWRLGHKPPPLLPGLPRDKAVESIFKNLHHWIGKATIALILLHVGAALKHHFINKDNILARMLPLRSKR